MGAFGGRLQLSEKSSRLGMGLELRPRGFRESVKHPYNINVVMTAARANFRRHLLARAVR